MAILGGPETVAATILRLVDQLDLMGLTPIFKLGAMPYDMADNSMRAFGEAVVPRIRHVLDRRFVIASSHRPVADPRLDETASAA
ncbi:MAG TPA: hypothetical protein VGG99_10150 [Acetobacteraceae bacterium]|jgi:hypothetical protein